MHSKRRSAEEQARRGVVAIRAGGIGALTAVAQTVIVAIGRERVGVDTRLQTARQRNEPAALPYANADIVEDFFTVEQAIAVGIGLIGGQAKLRF